MRQPLGGRLYRLLTPVMSLRVIVIVAALSVVALVITLGAWVWFGVTNDQYSQLDRRLDSLSSLGDISMLLRTAPDGGMDQDVADGGLVRTARVDGITVSVPRDIVLPLFENGYPTPTSMGSSTGCGRFRRATRRSRSAHHWPRRSAASTSCTDGYCSSAPA